MTQGRWWLPIATGLAGLAAGWILALRFGAQPESGVAAPAIALRSSTLPDGRAESAQGPTLEDLRRVVREELAAAAVPAGAGRVGSDATQAPSEPTAVQVAAGQRAHQLLDGAIARGRWSDADIDALQGAFHQLTTEQQAEVLQKYTMAVNQGRIVPETDRLPF